MSATQHLVRLACVIVTPFALGASAAQAAAPMAWCDAIEVAKGGGHRGPWRQNASDYDYVDDPALALDARGAASVVWVDQRRKDVFFQIYGRDGAPRLKQPVNVSRTPQVFSWLPRVALSPRHPQDVYVIWQEIVFSGGSHGGDIFFARSTDGGATFGSATNLSNSLAGDGKGRINRDVWHNGSLDLVVAPDGILHAAWTEYEGALWLSRSTDRGATFSKPLKLGRGGDVRPARAPALAAARDGTLFVAWTLGEDDRADIHVAVSTDGGGTFGDPRVVAQTPGYSDAPKIAVDGSGVLHLVHAESAAGPFDRQHIRYTRSRDGGRTFEPAREISARAASAAFPALALDGANGIHVLWETYTDHRRPSDGLALATSRDSGDRFGPPLRVPGDGGAGAFNGSQQGLLMRKLDARGDEVAIVNSTFRPRAGSRVWLTRGGGDACRR